MVRILESVHWVDGYTRKGVVVVFENRFVVDLQAYVDFNTPGYSVRTSSSGELASYCARDLVDSIPFAPIVRVGQRLVIGMGRGYSWRRE